MPSTISKSKVQNSKLKDAEYEEDEFSFNLSGYKRIFSANKKYLPSKKVSALIILAVLLLIGIIKKDWFVAALVNNSPITNFELQNRLNDQFRTQILNQMIEEKIVLQEAKRQGVFVSDAEIQNRIAALEAKFGGPQVLDDLLAQQGQTRKSIRNQLKMPIAVEKLYDKEATYSAEEVDEFIKKNKKQLQSTDSASQTLEATAIIKQQKLSQIIKDKFEQLKQQAKIQLF